MVENLIKKNLIPISIVIAGVIIAGAIVYVSQGEKAKETAPAALVQPENSPAQEQPKTGGEPSLENFAKCLGQKGMKFYGASWCGWCEKQKELFGEAVQYLPYIECVDSQTNQLTSECQKEEISGFPTWQFSNGEKSPGFKSLEELAELSGCQL